MPNLGEAIQETITGSQATAKEFKSWCHAMIITNIIIAIASVTALFVAIRNLSKAK